MALSAAFHRAARPRSRSRSTRARWPRPMTHALGRVAASTAPASACRASIRYVQRAINRVQSYARDRHGGATVCGAAGIGRHQFRPDLRTAAPDRCKPAWKPCGLRRTGAGPFLGVRLCPCPVHQEAPAPDRRKRAARRRAPGRSRSKRSPRAAGRRGYLRIGLDHLPAPTDPMAVAQREGRLRRNFQGYTTDTADVLIGFGASAIGRCRRAMSRTRSVLG